MMNKKHLLTSLLRSAALLDIVKNNLTLAWQIYTRCKSISPEIH